MFVDDLWVRLMSRGFHVKRASVPRTLSRDRRFTRYADGWGLTAPPEAQLMGTSTNPSQIGVRTHWNDVYLSQPYLLNLPRQGKEVSRD